MYSKYLKIISLLAVFCVTQTSQASIIVFDSWTTNEGNSGHYILSIEHSDNNFNFDLSINPWNAEALGLFVDLGDVDLSINDIALTSPSNNILTHAIDTSSGNCGGGCNLNGLNPNLATDGEWELVFRLADQGFDNIQNFQFTTSDFGLELSDFQMVGVRAQQLCDDDNLLDNGDSGCGSSDKSYSNTYTINSVPESNIFILFIVAMVLLTWGHYQRKSTSNK